MGNRHDEESHIIHSFSLDLMWAGSTEAQRKPPPEPVNGAENGVYLKAALPLDESRHLCLDIPGHGGRVNEKRDLTVHSCKEGIWNLDERFVKSAIAHSDLKMPQCSLCVGAREAKTGSKVSLVACGSSKLAKWEYKEARFTLAGIRLCA